MFSGSIHIFSHHFLFPFPYVPRCSPVPQVGSANINDRSLLGDRDAELGAVVWAADGAGTAFPERLRSTLLRPLEWAGAAVVQGCSPEDGEIGWKISEMKYHQYIYIYI